MHYPISAYYTTISSYLLQAKTFFLKKRRKHTTFFLKFYYIIHIFRIRECLLLLRKTFYGIKQKKLVMDTGHNSMFR